MKPKTTQDYHELFCKCPLFEYAYVEMKNRTMMMRRDVVPPLKKATGASFNLYDGSQAYLGKNDHVTFFNESDGTQLYAFEDRYQIRDMNTLMLTHDWGIDKLLENEDLYMELMYHEHYAVLDKLYDTLKEILSYEHMETNKTAL